MGRRREDNLLPVALALRRESPLTSPDTKVEIGSEKTTKSFQNQNAGEQSHHRHVRQEYDDTVECVDKTCFFYHQLTSVCHIYIKADESAICEVPCDMSGCVDEIHLGLYPKGINQYLDVDNTSPNNNAWSWRWLHRTDLHLVSDWKRLHGFDPFDIGDWLFCQKVS